MEMLHPEGLTVGVHPAARPREGELGAILRLDDLEMTQPSSEGLAGVSL